MREQDMAIGHGRWEVTELLADLNLSIWTAKLEQQAASRTVKNHLLSLPNIGDMERSIPNTSD